MQQRVDDVRIQSIRPLIPAAILLEELPSNEFSAEVVSKARVDIANILAGTDPRLVVISGPCSIHDLEGAKDYAGKLKAASEEFKDDLLIVMRAYFEKPRTTVGWKGLVNDPYLDGSYRVNDGLRLARTLLVALAQEGLPAATEFLDTSLPQHLADLISYGAIGARTTESQTHRELASGLSMPVGFKNATDGNVRTAIDAVLAARSPHWFAGATKDGVSALVQTTGNDTGHVILRGGSRTGPNYHPEFVSQTVETLAKEGLPTRVMIDLSHGNSEKDYLKQLTVSTSVANQMAAKNSPIFGVMVESNLVEGRQDPGPRSELKYGQSITDACLNFDQTLRIFRQLAEARRTAG